MTSNSSGSKVKSIIAQAPIRFDYSVIGIHNKHRDEKLVTTIHTLDDSLLKKNVQNDNRIKATKLLYDDIKETKNLIRENLVEKVLKGRKSIVSTSPSTIKNTPIKAQDTLNESIVSIRMKSAIKRNQQEKHLQENQQKILEKRKTLLSAPAYRKSSDQGMLNVASTYNNAEIIIPDRKSSVGFNIDSNVENEEDDHTTAKTILRAQKPTAKMSMDVDKWVEIHQRRAKSAIAAHTTNQTVEITKIYKTDAKSSSSQLSKKFSNESLRANYPEVMIRKGSDDTESLNTARGRSRRELSELTVLEKVKKRNKVLHEEQLRELRKIQRRNEFNMIVLKIRNFLFEFEEFKQFYVPYDSYPSRITTSSSLSQRAVSTRPLVKLYDFDY